MVWCRVVLWTKQLPNCLATIQKHLRVKIAATLTLARSWTRRLSPGLRTWSKVSPPGGVNTGHSCPAALAMALSSLSGQPSATPYFCNDPTDKKASKEFAIQLSTCLWQIQNNHSGDKLDFLGLLYPISSEKMQTQIHVTSKLISFLDS